MQLTTQCPACATVFRIAQGQLATTESWVRCGHCDGVFEAKAYLRDPLTSDGLHVPDHAPLLSVDVPAQPDLAEPVPSFMVSRAGDVSGGSWWGRRFPLVLCLLLALCLVAQVLVQERDRLAAKAPALRPVLLQVCRLVGCAVLPLREIESIAIDSSAFTSLRPGSYLLEWSVKNTAPMDLAMPALELTLTDGQDQPLLRRVLLPTELGAKSVLAAGSEWSARLPMAVDGLPEKIMGYRLLVFYP